METNNKQIPLKPYTLKQLAEIFGVSVKTMQRWKKPFEEELGKKLGKYYTIPQVRIFFENLNFPENRDEKQMHLAA